MVFGVARTVTRLSSPSNNGAMDPRRLYTTLLYKQVGSYNPGMHTASQRGALYTGRMVSRHPQFGTSRVHHHQFCRRMAPRLARHAQCQNVARLGTTRLFNSPAAGSCATTTTTFSIPGLGRSHFDALRQDSDRRSQSDANLTRGSERHRHVSKTQSPLPRLSCLALSTIAGSGKVVAQPIRPVVAGSSRQSRTGSQVGMG